MSEKILTLVAIFFYFLVNSPRVWSGNYAPPPENSGTRGRASGARGCPVELGELEIISEDPANLKSARETPTLIYRVRGTGQPVDFLIVVVDREGNLVFERQLHLPAGTREEMIAVKLARPLALGQSYRVTAGILCEKRRDRATTLTSRLTRIPGSESTVLDILSDRYLDRQPRLIY